MDEVYINQEADSYVMEADGTLDLGVLQLQPGTIAINGKKVLVEMQTSRAKRTFADIQQKVLQITTAGSEANPLHIRGALLAASAPEQLTHEALSSKLRTLKGHVDNKVVDQMVQLFAAAIPLAGQELLSEYYDLAKASPLTHTKDVLRREQGLVFNGAFVAGAPSRAVLLIAFKNGAKPVLCKFTAEATAVDHEYSVLKALWQEPAVPGIDNNNNNLQAFQLIVARYLLGPSLQVKHCLQMPVYPATLQHIPAAMQESVILTFGRQLKTSLQNVHQKGYGHNDVKASNIFITATGKRQ
ncbi:TPA: hypothetical protein ACH3X3_010586 [Trebouxia sp. C0006]